MHHRRQVACRLFVAKNEYSVNAYELVTVKGIDECGYEVEEFDLTELPEHVDTFRQIFILSRCACEH